MSAPMLVLEAVGKDYPLLEPSHRRVATMLRLLAGRVPSHRFRAVDEVSFALGPGESLGVIGENGAGKSTLLKMIAGVIEPTRGRIARNARIGALLELGSGFHPEYSGLENIDLAGALMGLDRAALRAKRDEIVAFADIGEHIHQPIKQYSSGMVVRLGFGVATTIRPDLLITDEVLAVGDESFQRKCVAWLERYLGEGGALLLCSHSMYHVQKLCRSALWLDHGRQRLFGPAPEVTQAYLAWHEAKAPQGAAAGRAATAVVAPGLYGVAELSLHDADGAPLAVVPSGGTVVVRGTLQSPDGRVPHVTVGIVRADGTPVYGVVSDMDRFVPAPLEAGRFGFELELPRLSLLPGRYAVRAHAMDPEAMRLFDTVEVELRVSGSSRELGLVRLDHAWRARRG